MTPLIPQRADPSILEHLDGYDYFVEPLRWDAAGMPVSGKASSAD